MADRNEFDAAVAAVTSNPSDEDAWDEVESLAGDLELPDETAELFKSVLAQDIDKDVLLSIGERAANFYDEWFGDDPAAVEVILTRVLAIDPKSEWAFQRLTVAYTETERWADLLGLYDSALAAATKRTRQIQLLDEAAQVAKDVANQPDKAIEYLQRLLPLTPDDDLLIQSLERLLERHERWEDLIKLWETDIDDLPRKERERHRARIGEVWLDKLDKPQRALDSARPLLAEAENDKVPCGLLERILTAESATGDVREGALDLLRTHYEATDRPREIIRVLEAVIPLAGPELGLELREEAGARLAELDDDAAAMEHYGALLALKPDSAVTQERLRQISQRSGQYNHYATAVAKAAEHTDNVARKVALLAEAARTRLDMLEDEDGAISLYQAAIAQEGIEAREERLVARRLSELLARADRPQERLDILERLGGVETTAASQRAVLGETARLAESLGETDRALAAWKRRLDANADDLWALDATVALLEGEKRWEPLIEVLSQRITKAVASGQKRSDLVRIATIYKDELSLNEQAIAAWLRVQNECGEDPETVNALADLLSAEDQWTELAELLQRASGRETEMVTGRLVRLADAQRAHLDAPGRALGNYKSALAIDPNHEGAGAGMAALLEDETLRPQAANALVDAYRATENWPRFLELVGPRLADAPDDSTRLVILREAADIQMNKVDDQAGALASLAQAFPLAPKDRVLETQIVKLAAAVDAWPAAATAYEQAASALAEQDPHEACRLRFEQGKILEGPLDSAEAAHTAFFNVTGMEPGNIAAVRAVVRNGTRLGKWDETAIAVMAYIADREKIDMSLFQEMEEVAAEQSAFDDMVQGITAALNTTELPVKIAFELHKLVALWHRDRREHAEAAILSLKKALSFDNERADALVDLAALQRPAGGRELFDTLWRLSDVDQTNLDVAYEAAEIAVGLEEPELQLTALTRLVARSTAAWRGTTPTTGERAPDDCARWAVGKLVDYYSAVGKPAAAVDALVEAARLPFDLATKREMRHRAASIAASEVGDNSMAIEMYRGVLALSPEDTEAMDKMAALLQAEERTAELLSLRKHQLTLDADADSKLGLRLEIAHLVGEVERKGGRLDVLRANLADSPGHEQSVDALCELLDSKSQHAQLADMLEEQAARLEELEDVQRAALLWARVAEVAEHHTEQIDRAISAHKKVVSLAPTTDALRALARLNMERGRPAAAVPWYENLLAGLAGDERDAVVLQLATAHVGAEQNDRAVACIESHLTDDLPAIELRTMLADLYRQSRSWEPLARHLTRSLPLLADKDQAIAFAREAAQIYSDELGAPSKAIPALETALSLVEGDRGLRTQLGIGLRVAGRLEEARELLMELIAEFGRRRTPERAAVHVELARVYQAEGNGTDALKQMEKASKMDAGNARIQKVLAELAREAGKVDKAERTYRALLLVVRRQPPGDDVSAVGVSEVLFELHKLAAERGEDEQAKEQMESALETAVQSDAEVRRLRRSLLAHGEPETLLRVLKMRLENSDEPKSRASLYADMAETYDTSLDKPSEALDAMLDAIKQVPDRLDLHDRARDLAKRSDRVNAYVEAVDETVDNLRRKEDPPLVAQLLMKAGEALEIDGNDPAGAKEIYKRVEATGERTAEAYFAIARVAGTLGDTEEQARALDAMLQLASTEESDEPSPAQVDALYALAEIFVNTEGRLAQGVELIEQAFNAEPRYVQAGNTLRVAAAVDANDDRVMALYDRVARNANDWELLLDFLERRAGRADATPSQVKEACDVAAEHDQHERGEALLARAVEAARETVDGIGGAIWAVVALAERKAAKGDLEAARDLIYEIAGFADPEQVNALTLGVAQKAAEDESSRELAAELFEFLRDREPAAPHVWGPLIDLYRVMGDSGRLEAVVANTLPNLVTTEDRNALRMQHARYMIDELERHDDAREVLKDLLLDDPDHLEAAALLEEVLRSQGNHEGLADFLWQRFEDAKGRGNPDTVTDVAMRLGALLDKMESHDAASVYTQALEVAPQSPELLRAVIQHLDPETDPREGGQLMERLLAVETEERAPSLTAELTSLWESLEDEGGVQRALELGHRQAPDDVAIHQQLENWYRDRQLWKPLATLMTTDADRLDGSAATARLREAAGVFRDMLGDPSSAALVLRKARMVEPDNDTLVSELASCLTVAGDLHGAIQALSDALETDIQGMARVGQLLQRADLYLQVGNSGAAVTDLEEAYSLDPDAATQPLLAGLDRRRIDAADTHDREVERSMTMRLAKLLAEAGDVEQAHQLLSGWVEREPRDREPLLILRDMYSASESWEGVIATCSRLVVIEEGDDQIDAALRLADAAEKAGRPGDALRGLEHVHQAQPNSVDVRNKLRHIYELSGAYRELANVLLADAAHAEDDESRYIGYHRASEVLLYNIGDAAAALEPAQAARDLKPDSHGATVLFVDVLTGAGMVDQAVAVLEPAIAAHKRRSPELAALQQRMARVAAVGGDRDNQLAWLKKAFDVDRKNGEIAAELAQLATEAGDYDLALKPLRAITLMDNPGPISRVMALLWEAKIEHARGNRAKAELWAKKALREDPEFAEAQDFLTQIQE